MCFRCVCFYRYTCQDLRFDWSVSQPTLACVFCFKDNTKEDFCVCLSLALFRDSDGHLAETDRSLLHDYIQPTIALLVRITLMSSVIISTASHALSAS